MSADFLQRCREIVGPDFVLTSPADCAPFLTDWRGRFTGRALAVLRPHQPQQVAQLVRACADARITLVPQGEMTQVSWDMTGPMPFISKIMSVFASMDSMIGKDFEKGLANMKAAAEK